MNFFYNFNQQVNISQKTEPNGKKIEMRGSDASLAFLFHLNPFVHGRFSRPITYIENGIIRFLYIHIAYPKFWLKKISVLRVLGLKKASKFDRFQKFQNQNLNI